MSLSRFRTMPIRVLAVVCVALVCLQASPVNAQYRLITQFSPASGPAGTIVTLDVINFPQSTPYEPKFPVVNFGPVRGKVLTYTSSKITVQVPVGAAYGPIEVVLDGKVVTSRQSFMPLFAGMPIPQSYGIISIPADVPTQAIPTTSLLKDFNHDGKPDIVYADQAGNSLYLLYNTTTDSVGRFTAAGQFAVGTNPVHIATGDIDGNGKPDLVVVNKGSNTLTVFQNTGTTGANAPFNNSTTLATGSNPAAVVIADLNVDNLPDLAVVNTDSNTISVYNNTFSQGALTFGARTSFATGNQPSYVAACDLDGDNRADLIVANKGSNTVSVFRNLTISVGAPVQFAAGIQFAAGTEPVHIVIGDVDSDGKPDIIVTNRHSAAISVLKNNSTAGALYFSTEPNLKAEVGQTATSAAIGDFNGDGKPDVLVAADDQYPVHGSVRLFSNTSAGGFINFHVPYAVVIPAQPGTVHLADIEGDGKPDIVTGSLLHQNFRLLHNGSPAFYTEVSPTNITPGVPITVKGKNLTSVVGVQLGSQPAASFTKLSDTTLTFTMGATGSLPVKLLLASGEVILTGVSINQEGPSIRSISPVSGPVGTPVTITGTAFDPVAGNNTVYMGAVRATVTAATTTQLTVTVPIGTNYDPVTVTTGQRTAQSLQRFNTTFAGADTFTTNTLAPSLQILPNASRSVKLKDMDGDGNVDMLQVNASGLANNLSILKHAGRVDSLGFVVAASFTTGNMSNHLEVGDLDGDGKPDVAVTAGLSSGISLVSVFRNTSTPGNFTMAPRIDLTPGQQAMGLVIVDVTADGKPDIVVANYSSYSVSVFRNTSTPGNLSFEPKVDLPMTGQPYALAAGDLDGDQLPDLVVTTHGINQLHILRNTSYEGKLNFFAPQTLPLADAVRHLIITDLDNDGKADIAATTPSQSSAVTIYKNTTEQPGDISFRAPLFYAPAIYSSSLNTSSAWGIAAGDINGDGKPDLAISRFNGSSVTLLRNLSSAGELLFGDAVDISGAVNGGHLIAIGDINGDQRADAVVSTMGGLAVLNNLSGQPTATISSFSPATGATGDTITIRGTLLTGTKQVNFGGIGTSRVVVLSDTLLKAVVPNAATDGIVDVITPQGKASASGFVYTGPVITSFAPMRGSKGSVITIYGKHLTGATQAFFGTGTATPVEVLTDTSVRVVIDSANDGRVRLVTPGGTASANSGFVYVKQLAVYYHSPVQAPVGATVTITGSQFYPHIDSNIVYFGPVKAVVISATSSELRVQVPAGATYSRISVTSQQQTAWSDLFFGVLYPGGQVAFSSASFATPIQVPTGGKPVAAAVADFDTDGKPDLALIHAQASSTLQIFRNTATADTIRFAAGQSLAGRPNLQAIAVADLDGDGKQDIAVGSMGSTGFSLYRNTSSGSISFDAAVDYNTAGGVSLIGIANLDLDSKPDIAIYEPHSGKITLYQNMSTPGQYNFVVVHTITPIAKVIDMHLADITRDGYTDILVTLEGAPQGQMTLYSNSPSPANKPTFGYSHHPLTNRPGRIIVSEMNADEEPDIIYINDNERAISTSEGYSYAYIPRFHPPIDYPVTGAADLAGLAAHDLNGDRFPEVIVARSQGQAINVYKNQSTANGVIALAAPVAFATGTTANNVYAADLDGDGKADLLTTNPLTGNITILKNTVGHAALTPSGVNPVTGKVKQQVELAPEVPSLNGTPYVQRSYALTAPGSQPNATATVTFYFTQYEFNQFNAHPNSLASLPDSANDAQGIANLRIYQYVPVAGARTGETAADSIKVINPDDARIVWNNVANCWEITVEVTGLNKFIVSAVGFAYKQVTGPAITVAGATDFCEGGSVTLTSSAATNNQWYKDNNAIAGATEHFYKPTTSGVYTVTTIVEEVRTSPSTGKTIRVNPIPARPVITPNGQELVSSATAGNQWYREGVAISGATGPVYKPSDAANYSVTTTVGGCTSAHAASVYFATTGIINIDNTQYISLNPNPATDFLLFNFNVTGATKLNIRLVDLQGKVVRTWLNQISSSRLYVADLPPGLYLVKITGAGQKINHTMKMLKR